MSLLAVHRTPRYLWDRISVMAYEWSHPDAPWLTREGVRLLGAWLQPGDKGLEWGSGRSTIWLAQRGARLVSVEHDGEWATRVRNQLVRRGLSGRVDHRVFDVSNQGSEAAYAGVAAGFADAELDFVIVDGLCRDACGLAGLPKVKPGGLLIIDNANWYLPRDIPSRAPNSRTTRAGFASERWREFADAVEGWRLVATSDGVTDTWLWFKPCGRHASEAGVR